MDLIKILNELWKRRLWVLAAVVVAALVGISTTYSLPSFEKQAQLTGAASSQVLIDSSTSAIADVERDPAPLANRAVVLAQYMSSSEARTAIAAKMDISPGQIAADGPFSTLTDRSTYQAVPAGPRANQLTEENAVYRLVFDAQLTLPILSIYTQAPDAASATELAAAATAVLTSYVKELDEGIPTNRQITVRSLGEPEGGTVNDSASATLAFMAFVGVLIMLCALIVIGSGLVRQWREMKTSERHDRESELAEEPAGIPQIPDAEELLQPLPGERRGVRVEAPRQYS